MNRIVKLFIGEKKIPDIQSDSGGVVVKGYNSNGYIENTNVFPVTIKGVSYKGRCGECTNWVKLFRLGEKILQFIEGSELSWEGQAFYVYNMEGVMIGFVRPEKSKNKRSES